MAIFTGSGVAIVTPMKDNLEVNYDKLEELIDFHVKGGTGLYRHRRNDRRGRDLIHGRTQKRDPRGSGLYQTSYSGGGRDRF